MKRFGKYSGTIYNEDYDFSKCPECCVMIPEGRENDEDYILKMRVNNLVDCMKCMSPNVPHPCPASKNPLI